MTHPKWKRRAKKGRTLRLPYHLISKTNAAFESYYTEQRVVPDGEWNEFLAALRRNLPLCLRVRRAHPLYALAVAELRQLEAAPVSERVEDAPSTEEEALEAAHMQCAQHWLKAQPWGGVEAVVWTWERRGCERDALHSNALKRYAGLKDLRAWMLRRVEQGLLHRQEAVSMLPPLCLDVRCSHKVLDMCAAPGTKTSMLLDIMAADYAREKREGNADAITPGVVWANDLDFGSAAALTHVVSKFGCPELLVSYADAAKLCVGAEVKFDRVVCDVPCSGDATLRKNADKWLRWNTAMGVGHHGQQLRILMRGLALLTCGGRLVYSTCSLNPVENEAVVAAALTLLGNRVRLRAVPVLPGARWRGGLHDWAVPRPHLSDAGATRSMEQEAEQVEQQADEVEQAEQQAEAAEQADDASDAPLQLYREMAAVPPELTVAPRRGSGAVRLTASMFASSMSADAIGQLHHCVRVLPHHMDTSGFFLAVFERVPKAEAAEAAVTQAPKGVQALREEHVALLATPAPSTSKQSRAWLFHPLKPTSTEWASLSDFFGLDTTFSAQIVFRDQVGKHILFATTAAGRALVQEATTCKFKFVGVGTRLVRRYPTVAGTAAVVPSAVDTQGEQQQQQQQQQHGDAQQPFVRDAAWRVCAEGAQTLAQHMTKRLLRLSDPGAGVFRRLLDGDTIVLHELQSACSDGTCDGLDTCISGEAGHQMTSGGVVVMASIACGQSDSATLYAPAYMYDDGRLVWGCDEESRLRFNNMLVARLDALQVLLTALCIEA